MKMEPAAVAGIAAGGQTFMDDKKQKQELITIVGGVEMEVSFQNNGSKELVKVRQIPISKLSQFIAVMGNDSECIELYCDKPKGWADTLSVESAIAIADKGQEINIPFFASWFRRQMKWRQAQDQSVTTLPLPADTAGAPPIPKPVA